MKFKLGKIVSTPGALGSFRPETIERCLARHAAGDWGDLDPEDKKENDKAVVKGTRIMSSYTFRGDRTQAPELWIITEHDRSVTTILLPDEY